MKFPSIFSIIFLILTVFVTITVITPSFAEDSTESAKREVEDRIKSLQDKVNELSSKRTSLSKQVEYYDSQIRLTTYQIQEEEKKLKQLELDIVDLTGRIGQLDESLDYLSGILVRRMGAAYEHGKVDEVEVFLGSAEFNDWVERVKYLQMVQSNDRKLLAEMQSTRNDYSLKRDDLQIKQDDVKATKKRLDGYKVSLNQTKSEQEALLKQTKNSEEEYRRLLDLARAEQKALEEAISTANFAQGTPINAGDPIAVMGNSGAPYCSTGPHLHYEVRTGGTWTNAENYLTNRSLLYESAAISIGSGSWSWPMKNPIITQRYGKTPYSWRYIYSGGIHTGVDMYDNGNTTIYAPYKGKYIRGTVPCGPIRMNFVAIDHENGIQSYFLHVK